MNSYVSTEDTEVQVQDISMSQSGDSNSTNKEVNSTHNDDHQENAALPDVRRRQSAVPLPVEDPSFGFSARPDLASSRGNSTRLPSFMGNEFENSLVLFNRVIIEGSSTTHDHHHSRRRHDSTYECAAWRNDTRLPDGPLPQRRPKVAASGSNTLRCFSSLFQRRYDGGASRKSKRLSMPGCLEACSDSTWNQEPIHMTLEEVRSSMHRVSLDGDHREQRDENRKGHAWSLKRAFRGLFGTRYTGKSGHRGGSVDTRGDAGQSRSSTRYERRALPPVPSDVQEETFQNESCSGLMPFHDDHYQNYMDNRLKDFASSIQKVKDYGWYWGPLSGEIAERILANEPNGSFIVRDSSDEHYIFSLTFKLNGLIRHVRIEHDQGNFSFGTLTNFKSHTIVEFIQNAVEHSRSGRYLFFLHHRPVLGPMRVQLLYPVSRFKQVQSLQHMCRFVILKIVRRDLVGSLPLPKRMKEYLNTRQYYSEFAEEMQEQQQQQPVNVSPTLSLITRAAAGQDAGDV